MRPKPFRRMIGRASRVVWKADDRLIARIASHFSIGNSSILATCWMPALLTRMSSRPNPSNVFAIMLGDLAGLRHVGAEIERPDAEIPARCSRLGRADVLGPAEAVEDDFRAGRCERAGDAEADAARRAGDQRDLAGERGSGLVGTLQDFDVHGQDLLPAGVAVPFARDTITVHRRRLQRKYRLATVSMQTRYGDAGIRAAQAAPRDAVLRCAASSAAGAAGAAMSSMREPESPVMRRVPRWKVK